MTIVLKTLPLFSSYPLWKVFNRWIGGIKQKQSIKSVGNVFADIFSLSLTFMTLLYGPARVEGFSLSEVFTRLSLSSQQKTPSHHLCLCLCSRQVTLFSCPKTKLLLQALDSLTNNCPGKLFVWGLACSILGKFPAQNFPLQKRRGHAEFYWIIC